MNYIHVVLYATLFIYYAVKYNYLTPNKTVVTLLLTLAIVFSILWINFCKTDCYNIPVLVMALFLTIMYFTPLRILNADPSGRHL